MFYIGLVSVDQLLQYGSLRQICKCSCWHVRALALAGSLISTIGGCNGCLLDSRDFERIRTVFTVPRKAPLSRKLKHPIRKVLLAVMVTICMATYIIFQQNQ